MTDRSLPRARRSAAPGRLIVAATLALTLTACGGTGPPTATRSAPTAATPSPVESPSPTPAEATPSAPSPSATSSASATFESTHYRYALTLPPRSAILAWHTADRPWDGQAKFDMAGPYADRTAVAEGGLYFIGSEAESLDEFFARYVANGTRYHGCTEAQNRTDVTIGDVPAIAFTQRCANDAAVGRVALFKDGFGLGTWIASTTGKEVAARDRLIELLDGLEWRTG